VIAADEGEHDREDREPEDDDKCQEQQAAPDG
jgi:hypothetical protein